MAVLGGRREKDRKRQPLSGSFSHQKKQEQAAASATRPRLPPLSSQSFPATQTVEQKASPDVEDEEGGKKAERVLCYEETVTGLREPFRL